MEPGLLREQRETARARLAPEVFAYADQGAGAQVTRRSAEGAWDDLRLLPRTMRDVTTVDATTHVLGERWSCPVGVAPMSMQRAAHPGGEVATARAVAAEGSTLVLSSNTGATFAEVHATGARWWIQLYATEQRELGRDLAARAVDAGAAAVVLTVDTPVVATKVDERIWDVADPSWLGAELPGGATTSRDGGSVPSRRKAADLGWDDVEHLTSLGVPVVLKGVLHPDDAGQAVEHGVDAVWVSNHGGRQLDQAVETARALPAVAQAVRQASRRVGRPAQVYVDGGVRTPAHLVAAHALGADAVFLGRPVFWALASDHGADAPAVRRLLDAARAGVVEALRILGSASLADVTAAHLADLRRREWHGE